MEDTKYIKQEHIQQFTILAQTLSALMGTIREYNPEAGYYATTYQLNLLKGPAHNYNTLQVLSDNLIETVGLTGMDSGDW